ncbi:plasmid replication initiator TrfA [Alcaligenes sp. Lyrl_28]|uniref:plasmid replication initiator TrfA n=1 Tax=Alcaligenes sp. Lyrl_28 TaxID=3110924 RepID=UPI003F7C276F
MTKFQHASRTQKLRVLADATAKAAMDAAPLAREKLLEASNTLSSLARSSERHIKGNDDPVKTLPSNATKAEVALSRRRQATRHGADTYLPSLSDFVQVMPHELLRCSLFSSNRTVQAKNEQVLTGDTSLLVANKKIASFNNVTVELSGYELCQFDRVVYATCLDYYRERPLSREVESRYVETNFYEFSQRMGRSYSTILHRSIRASLLRLSFAQLRIRRERLNLEVPKLLSASFEDSEQGAGSLLRVGRPMGSDRLWLRVGESVAELFGPGAWTGFDQKMAHYTGLQGWLASFYATHQAPLWLEVKKLYDLSGYESRFSNFRKGLCEALDKLKAPGTPRSCQIAEYRFTADGMKVEVHKVDWKSV